MQSNSDGHDTPVRLKHPLMGLQKLGVSMGAACQVEAPPVGSVDVITFPTASTATHSATDGHETPVNP
jgi:hypothetical protein